VYPPTAETLASAESLPTSPVLEIETVQSNIIQEPVEDSKDTPRPQQDSCFDNTTCIQERSSYFAKILYLTRLYDQTRSTDVQAQIDAEKRSMAMFDGLFGDIQKKLGLSGRYESTRIDFDCLKSSIDLVEAGCGRLSDYALQYVKFLADHCSNDGRADSFAPFVKANCPQ